MRFWEPEEYTEHYVVKFKDVNGDNWEISIQDPIYVGEPVELTGADIPIEWEGVGDEKQDEVVLGSTGTIRLICQPGQENIFQYGALLPTEINDRRIQVFKSMRVHGTPTKVTIWQGFIKPSVFSQDWDSTPYDISIPIVSAIAATEYFFMPEDESLFDSQTTVGGMLRVMIFYLACDFWYIFTNKAIYEDLNGSIQYIQSGGISYPAHWTQGAASGNMFRGTSDGKNEQKSFKEILETLLSPFGKIQEFGTDLYVLMRQKNDAIPGTKIQYIEVWDSYLDYRFSTENRFSEARDIPQILLSDIITDSQDNTFSIIPSPRAITTSANINNEEKIFELSETMIKPSLPSDGYSGRNNVVFQSIGDGSSPMRRCIYVIDRQYINPSSLTELVTYNEEFPEANNFAFCRVAEARGSSNTNVDYSLRVPLALCFNLSDVVNVKKSVVGFVLNNGVRTIKDVNAIKLELEMFSRYSIEPQTSITGLSFSIIIKDLKTGRYLQPNKTWGVSNSLSISDFSVESSKRVLRFNEDRGENDNVPHSLQITFAGFSQSVSFPISTIIYGKGYIIPTISYETTRVLFDDVLWQKVIGNVGYNNYTFVNGGPGEDLSITFKTMCGMKNRNSQGPAIIPYNSFCDNINRIDKGNRKMIEINDAQWQVYYGDQDNDFTRRYMVVVSGSDVFIPVAVGMNPRMNTLKLRLVSTNVGDYIN